MRVHNIRPSGTLWSQQYFGVQTYLLRKLWGSEKKKNESIDLLASSVNTPKPSIHNQCPFVHTHLCSVHKKLKPPSGSDINEVSSMTKENLATGHAIRWSAIDHWGRFLVIICNDHEEQDRCLDEANTRSIPASHIRNFVNIITLNQLITKTDP